MIFCREVQDYCRCSHSAVNNTDKFSVYIFPIRKSYKFKNKPPPPQSFKRQIHSQMIIFSGSSSDDYSLSAIPLFVESLSTLHERTASLVDLSFVCCLRRKSESVDCFWQKDCWSQWTLCVCLESLNYDIEGRGGGEGLRGRGGGGGGSSFWHISPNA
jgi:hypothetical protein